MRILCLTDFSITPGDRWLWNFMPSSTDEVEFLEAKPVNDLFPKWGKLISYYPTYWQLGLRALKQTRKIQYDLVVAWEGKNGFPYAMLRTMFKKDRPPLLILCFSYRGLIKHFGFLGRFAMRSVDQITVTTSFEVDHYQRILNLPQEKISLCLLGWYDIELTGQFNQVTPSNRYVIAAGRSYRDYATLIHAVDGLNVSLLIIARKFNLAGIDIPNNVATMDLLPQQDFWHVLNRAKFVVVPLQHLSHAAGEISMIQAMSASKAVVATSTPSSRTYIEHGVTGLLVPPGDVEAMRRAVMVLWENPEEAKRMGLEARRRYDLTYTFPAFARRVQKILPKDQNGKA